MTLDSTFMLVKTSPGCETLLTNVALVRLVGRGNWPAPGLRLNIKDKAIKLGTKSILKFMLLFKLLIRHQM